MMKKKTQAKKPSLQGKAKTGKIVVGFDVTDPVVVLRNQVQQQQVKKLVAAEMLPQEIPQTSPPTKNRRPRNQRGA